LIPDRLYMARQGTTDSEAMLLAAVAMGLMDDPVAAIGAMLGRVRRLMDGAAIDEPLRFTAALTDGANMWAFRWASDGKPATLYWKHDEDGLFVVSEPIDGHREDWEAIPVGGCVIALSGEKVRVVSLM
jgi:glutamine amidotransferase